MVFVYGTLKRGGSNHHWLAQAVCMGEGETCEHYALYQGADPWPHLVESEARYPVQGELYSVIPQELAQLDELEECPQLYVRKEIAVRTAGNEEIRAWAYFSVRPEGDLLADGSWNLP